MRSAFFSFVFVLLSSFCSSQNLLNENNEWNFLYIDWFNNKRTEVVSIGDEVEIDGVRYTNILRDGRSVDLIHQISDDQYLTINPHYGEIMLYDFSLGVNDTFPLIEDRVFIVDQVDSIDLVSGQKRKRISGSVYNLRERDTHHGGRRGDLTWIEGIGSPMGLINYIDICLIDVNFPELLCFHNNEVLEYPQDPETCFISNMEEESMDFDLFIDVFPIPARKAIHISKDIIEYAIYDHRGRAVMHGKNYNQYDKIDVSLLSKGLYIMKGEAVWRDRFIRKFIIN